MAEDRVAMFLLTFAMVVGMVGVPQILALEEQTQTPTPETTSTPSVTAELAKQPIEFPGAGYHLPPRSAPAPVTPGGSG